MVEPAAHNGLVGGSNPSRTTNFMEIKMRDELSTYFSDDGTQQAKVYHIGNHNFEVDFYQNSVKIATESYENKSLQYHQDAAENYVLGIKKF